MFLASLADIRAGLGFDDMPDPNAAIAQALHAAEARLSARLRTGFARVAATDIFFVEESGNLGGSPRTEFLLSHGFVDTSEPRTVAWASAYADLADAARDIKAEVFLNADKGVLVDLTHGFERAFVQTGYVAGFAADGSNTQGYDLAVVPGWLQEAAKLQALILLDSHPILTNADIKQNSTLMQAALDDVISAHVRYAPAAHKPVN